MFPTTLRLAFRRLILQTHHLTPGAQAVFSGLHLFVNLRATVRVRGQERKFDKLVQPSREEDDRDEMPRTAFYAVAVGRTPGIYSTWAECEGQVRGFGGSAFKKFNTAKEAQAFIDQRKKRNAYSKSAALAEARDKYEQDSNVIPKASSSSGAVVARAASPATVVAGDYAFPAEVAELVQDGWMFTKTEPPRLIVYTDGSSLANGTKRAVAGAGVYWGERKAGLFNLAERVPGKLQTNNRGELLSIIRAIETCPFDFPLEIRTDSQYSIQALTLYLPKWIKNGWQTKTGPVKNADMIRHLLVLLRRRAKPVRFKHVKGHSGHEGNEQADVLARQGAIRPQCDERDDWLDPDDEDPVATDEKEPTDIAVDIDPEWLMSEAELASFERSLEDEVDDEVNDEV